MDRVFVGFILVFATAGCASQHRADAQMQDLVFLTRGGCVNTATLRKNLDEALASIGVGRNYQFVSLDTLPVTDARTGYPTPTLLYRDRDLFGMAVPSPPFPEPT